LIAAAPRPTETVPLFMLSFLTANLIGLPLLAVGSADLSARPVTASMFLRRSPMLLAMILVS
jgi:hypothetical protein